MIWRGLGKREGDTGLPVGAVTYSIVTSINFLTSEGGGGVKFLNCFFSYPFQNKIRKKSLLRSKSDLLQLSVAVLDVKMKISITRPLADVFGKTELYARIYKTKQTKHICWPVRSL
jgi:hypothetical protein